MKTFYPLFKKIIAGTMILLLNLQILSGFPLFPSQVNAADYSIAITEAYAGFPFGYSFTSPAGTDPDSLDFDIKSTDGSNYDSYSGLVSELGTFSMDYAGEYEIKILDYNVNPVQTLAQHSFTVENPYTIAGTKGENDFYTSEVTVTLKNGFYKSGDNTANYKYTINQDCTSYPITLDQRDASGNVLRTKTIDLVDKERISSFSFDLSDPTITGINAADGVITLNAGETLPVTCKDENGIMDISVNGTSVLDNPNLPSNISFTEVTNGYEVSFGKPSETKDYTITVKDLAGRTTTSSFTLFVESKKEEPAKVKSQRAGSVSIPSANNGLVYYKESYSPSVKLSAGEANPKAVYTYRKAGEEAFTSTKPALPGEYEVKATIPENNDYYEFSTTAKFRIEYLPVTEADYSYKGTKGENGFYTSDVTITPVEGLQIAAGSGALSVNELVLKEDYTLKSFVLRKASTGAESAPIAIKDILIDTTFPEITGLSGDSYYYEDEFLLSFQDSNSFKVYINNELQTLNENNTLTLDPDGGKMEIKLSVTDEAGNTVTENFFICASWLKDKIIPANKSVSLESGESYKLGAGNWKIKDDPLTYYGGFEVYTAKESRYYFYQ
ncbi:MAG: hypothetical protein PUE21_05210 [Lachnospiraceae bacterium]|nr:hypothetical protein [Lachnospiraceae bacterium]